VDFFKKVTICAILRAQFEGGVSSASSSPTSSSSITSVNTQTRLGDFTETSEWLRNNFEQDYETAIPKDEVYQLYKNYITEYNLNTNEAKKKPVSTADFGKIVRQVFPEVKARRLGQRGNSKYCYANIKKCVSNIKSPKLQPIEPIDLNFGNSTLETKLLHWGSVIFNYKFQSIDEFVEILISYENNINISKLRKRTRSFDVNKGWTKRDIDIARPSDSSDIEPEMTNYFSHGGDEDSWPQLRSLLNKRYRHTSENTADVIKTHNLINSRSQSVPIHEYYNGVAHPNPMLSSVSADIINCNENNSSYNLENEPSEFTTDIMLRDENSFQLIEHLESDLISFDSLL